MQDNLLSDKMLTSYKPGIYLCNKYELINTS